MKRIFLSALVLSMIVPALAAEGIPASGTAYASVQTVLVDGQAVPFQMYALRDENGNDTNYVKLRDLAHVLNGTGVQFDVTYDPDANRIGILSGQPYTDTGVEMTAPYSGDQSYTGGSLSLDINGSAGRMTAITITDSNGGGYTYFKLRDLGAALGFYVGWSAEQGICVDTQAPEVG